MLRAYDYTESAAGRNMIQTFHGFSQELKLAKSAVEQVLQLEIDGPSQCPGCGSSNLSNFFTKWDVPYLRCHDCGSVFAEAEEETLRAYQKNEKLCCFRTSEEYQKEAAEKRKLSWQEILDWIAFRSFRYLGHHHDLNILSGGDRYTYFVQMMKNSPLCKTYKTLGNQESGNNELADIAVSLNLIQQFDSPEQHLRRLNSGLAKGGLLFLSARLGTGFDILVLREHAQIYPYEYVSLLSQKGLNCLFQRTGFELLDYSTPGHMDIGYVQSKRAFIPEDNLFVRDLIDNSSPIVLGEFQRFLQKSGMSSYAHIVAKKVNEG